MFKIYALASIEHEWAAQHDYGMSLPKFKLVAPRRTKVPMNAHAEYMDMLLQKDKEDKNPRLVKFKKPNNDDQSDWNEEQYDLPIQSE